MSALVSPLQSLLTFYIFFIIIKFGLFSPFFTYPFYFWLVLFFLSGLDSQTVELGGSLELIYFNTLVLQMNKLRARRGNHLSKFAGSICSRSGIRISGL